jgi:ankyrin repeat protein
MLSTRLQDIRNLFTFLLILVSANLFAQRSANDTISYDTTDYIPVIYDGALDYNLMIAASHGYTGEINRLIMKGADILAETQQGVTPLIFAVSNNRIEATKLLLDYGSDPDKRTIQGDMPLFIAVKNQNAELTEALIRAGSSIDSTDKFKATPLHYASVYDYFQIADMLLYYNALIEKKSIEGYTPLLAAVWAGNADIADLLIQNGADIEARDKEGFTPFLMAALNGDTLIMDLLMKKGANIYALNNFNQNALSLAIISDKVEATKFLFKNGNEWVTKGNSAVSPYVAASKYQRKDMLPILRENNIPGKVKYAIDQVDVTASTRFFLHDIYTGASLAFKEPFLNAGILMGFDTKLWYTRVLIKQSEHQFYQYMDKGSVAYAGIFKNFTLTNNPFRWNFELLTSISGGYRFGDQLKGTLNAPSNKFMIIPSVSIAWIWNDLSVSVGANYMNTGFYHTGPVWLRIGVSYNLYFDKVRPKRKILKWY